MKGNYELKKYNIGYATGVFDLFHVGHLNYLKEAKKLCDYLIVGINSDSLVKEYKNKLPIIAYEDRFEIVQSIKYVDKVIVQNNFDKFATWNKVKFDVYFAGDTWKGTERYNKYEDQFKSVGVDVVYIPYMKEISSS